MAQISLRVDDSEPNEVTYATLEAAEKDKEMFGPFDSVEALMEDLSD